MKTIIDKTKKVLENESTFYILISLNVVIGFLIFSISKNMRFPDQEGYILMAESLLYNKFSSLYFLDKYYPETLRSPVYPAFITSCFYFFKSIESVKIIQLLLYCISIFLCLQIIKKINNAIMIRNLFLLFLIPNFQIVFYSGYISTEMLSIFLVILSIYLLLKPLTYLNSILIALFWGLLCLLKPVFILFVFIIGLYLFLLNKKNIYKILLIYSIFIGLSIPFGIWNLKNHGVFKITPVEGGAGVAHLGFWQCKLPDNYTEPFYWGNSIVPDYTKPLFYNNIEKNQNLEIYERKLNKIFRYIEKYESQEDKFYLKKMKKEKHGTFPLHNSNYTLAREELLKKSLIEDIKNEPIYYIKTRMYHFVRVYITGINISEFNKNSSIKNKLKAVYPFLVSFSFIFIGIVFLIYKIIKLRLYKKYGLMISLVLYVGLIHIPFAIQARYSISVHLLVLVMLSLIFFESKNNKT
jgi:hypothetical protein